MRLWEVDYTFGAVVDIDPHSGGQKAIEAMATVHVKGVPEPALSDEIEHSDSEEDDDKPDEISDDSSNLEDEVPVATKLFTGRIRRKKVKKRGDGDDVAASGKTRAKKAAPKDLLLKYLQPNVSNVADRSDYVNAGNGSLIGRASTRPVQQSKVSYEDPSSSGEEEQLPSVGLASRGQPEGISVAEDEAMGDADDEDFTDSEVLAFVTRKDAIKDRPLTEKSKLKDQTRKAQKTPVTVIDDCSRPSEGSIPSPSRSSSSVVKTQADNFEISPRKPLAQNHQRDVESAKGHVPERVSPQTNEKRQKENKAPKKRKLSLSKDSRRQLSLKSFLKAFPVQ